MVLRKNIKISREEAIHYLFNESSGIAGMFSSALSSVFSFAVSYYLLIASKFIPYNVMELSIIGGLFFGVGVGLYFIKKQEFTLYDKTHSSVYLHGLLTYPILVLVYASMFIYFLVPQWNEIANSTGGGTSLLSSIITALLVALIFSFLFNALWQIVDMFVMQIFAKHDWVIVAERDYFIAGLGMRFEEARRYGTSLSLVHIKIGIDPRKKRLLKTIYRRVSEAVREIDSISHYEDWNSFVILAPITEGASKGLIGRISKIIKEEMYKNGIRSSIDIVSDISSLSRETENEFDMLKPQETVTQTLSFDNIPK